MSAAAVEAAAASFLVSLFEGPQGPQRETLGVSLFAAVLRRLCAQEAQQAAAQGGTSSSSSSSSSIGSDGAAASAAGATALSAAAAAAATATAAAAANSTRPCALDTARSPSAPAPAAPAPAAAAAAPAAAAAATAAASRGRACMRAFEAYVCGRRCGVSVQLLLPSFLRSQLLRLWGVFAAARPQQQQLLQVLCAWQAAPDLPPWDAPLLRSFVAEVAAAAGPAAAAQAAAAAALHQLQQQRTWCPPSVFTALLGFPETVVAAALRSVLTAAG
ncbi:hypothetical protein, conserved [Eimeria tenella]|uniref:Uncharacterized protein n=1 Tax=Eimeria tenella TaxID=5802 RepID=U6L281_EIMTE|nr:hypothetical protein, conserved [Eimeria tenella]CDJ44482.1 hypothetical protein, conserved [Eimeria tenella]|eukprot:XP_013235231.1 hypothetical protein, conserved [Eimeria tenella]